MNKINQLFFDAVSIQVTWKCSLRCKDCCTGSPHKENRPHFDFNFLKDSIQRFFSLISHTRRVTFSGGEPLLRSDLPDLIEVLFNFSHQFDFLEIVTNGTIVPNSQLISCIEKYRDRITFLIDDYGAISKNKDKIVKIFEDHGINYNIRKYNGDDAYCGGWVDFGDFSLKHTDDEAHRVYKQCFFSHYRRNTDPYIDLSEGIVHVCVRSLLTLEHGAVENDTTQYINIMDKSKSDSELKEAIFHLMWARYLSACKYCYGLGPESKRITPAIQLSKNEN